MICCAVVTRVQVTVSPKKSLSVSTNPSTASCIFDRAFTVSTASLTAWGLETGNLQIANHHRANRYQAGRRNSTGDDECRPLGRHGGVK